MNQKVGIAQVFSLEIVKEYRNRLKHGEQQLSDFHRGDFKLYSASVGREAFARFENLSHRSTEPIGSITVSREVSF